MKNIFEDKNILITGGAGSIGRELIVRLLKHKPRVIRILDNNEGAQFSLQNELSDYKEELRFLIGDVRNRDRVERATNGIDFVFHLAALKHVMSCEYNPFEAVRTNILGIQNVVESALKNDVEKVIYTSSDKAANPNNTMGATKLLGERLMTSASYYKGGSKTIFASVRFGNILGSSGSVIPLWKYQIENNLPITITDHNMTRFIMSKNSAIDLILKCTEMAQGGEIFILKMPVIRIGDLADVIIKSYGNKKINIKKIGTKPGETYYEELMTESEAERALETEDMFIIPTHLMAFYSKKFNYRHAKSLSSRKRYDSRDEKTISKEEIKKLLKKEGLI